MIELFLVPALLLLALLAFARYHVALTLLAALLPTYLLRLSLGNIPTTFLELAIVITALAGLAQKDIRHQWSQAWQRLPKALVALFLLFLLAALISTIISPHLLTSLGILKGWIVVPLLLGWLIYSGSFGFKNLKFENWKLKITSALIISGAAVSIIGLFQIFTLSRIQSVYDVPNSLALFLAPLSVLAWWQKKIVIAVLLTAALLATHSIAASVAVAGTLAVGLIAWPRRGSNLKLISALVLLVMLAGTYFASTGRLAYLANPPNSISVRWQLWKISWELIKEHPLAGVGLGTFEPAYQEKLHQRFAECEKAKPAEEVTSSGVSPSGDSPEVVTGKKAGKCPLGEFVFRDPHNWLFSFWLNLGLLGLISFISLHVVVIKQALPAPSRQTQALLLALFAIVIHGLVDTVFWKNDLAALHWLLVALLLNQVRSDQTQDQPS